MSQDMDLWLTLIFPKSETTWDIITKISAYLQFMKKRILWKFGGVAQKLNLPRPFEVLDVFGGKSKSEAPNAFKFGTKRVTIEVNNWWKFGVDISNHFWEIEIWTFFSFNSLPSWYKNSFWKVFFYQLGKELKEKNA